MKTHQWNTGRHYDQHGQRMVAKVEDGHILFSDRSRHINGVIPLGDYLKALGDRDSWWFMFFYAVTFGGFVGLAASLTIYFNAQYGLPAVMALIAEGLSANTSED